MPSPTLKILASQRDALYEQVRTHLGALNDVWIAMDCNKDFATAERLAIEFGEDFRLMEDLGWNPKDDRDRVELTMEPHDLMEVARRLRDEAKGGLDDSQAERQATEEEKAIEELNPPTTPARRSCGCSGAFMGVICMCAGHRRLRPGELDGLVLSYLRKHGKDGPLTATAIGKGIKRSPGAVANCLARLVKAKQVRLAKKTPRAYLLKGAKAR